MTRDKIIYISINYILLIVFAFAAITKLLEQEKFYTNLVNSPMLELPSLVIHILSWLIPILEGVVVIGLIWKRFQIQAIYLIVILLITYIIYSLAILLVAPYSPCSCGGVIALIDWTQHLYLQIGLLSLTLVEFYYHFKISKN